MLSEVKFKEVGHSYTNKEGKKYTSVTTLLGLYKNPYDTNFWTFYKAVQRKLNISEADKSVMSKLYRKHGGNWDTHPVEPLYKICAENFLDVDSLLVDKNTIRQEWKEKSDYANERGTRFHNKMEEEAYGDGKGGINNIEAPTAISYNFDLTKLEDKYYAEILLYNHEYELAGMMDKLIIYSVMNQKYAKGDDWKTNRVINTTNPIGKKMKFPLNHLDDCNYIHYALQINTYLWMLSNFGYTPELPSQFTHVLLNDKEQEIGRRTYITPNLQKEVVAMLNHYRNK